MVILLYLIRSYSHHIARLFVPFYKTILYDVNTFRFRIATLIQNCIKLS